MTDLSNLTDKDLYQELRGALCLAFKTANDSDEQIKLEHVLETIRLRLYNHGGVDEHPIFKDVALRMCKFDTDDLTNKNVIPTIRNGLMHTMKIHPWDFGLTK